MRKTQNAFRGIVIGFYRYDTPRISRNISINCINKKKSPLLQKEFVSDIRIRCSSILLNCLSRTQNSVNSVFIFKKPQEK